MTESQRQMKITILANLCEIFGMDELRIWLRMKYSDNALREVLDGR